ncbi:MAG TPA: HNH endonuclease signature motif containing protein [Streptosporangiaceae bacterium]|nr:HNH endonuclease signature motif containing protein [Streptosporangiaceae bacterium]
MTMNWVDHPLARPAAPAVPEAIEAGFTHTAAGEVRDRAARGFEAGGPADLLPPCPELAALTGMALEAGVERLTDDELVGVMRAARRVQSWQAAVELACADELAGRRQAVAHESGPSGRERATAEIGCALTLTGRSAEALIDLAEGVQRAGIGDALAEGWIDVAKARVFTEELAGLRQIRAWWIATHVMVEADKLTTAQLRGRLRRAVLAEDPGAARARAEQARAGARVEMWPEGSGNYAIAGRELPEAGAVLADRHVSALAKALKRAGRPGSMDQIRAEVYLALLSGTSPADVLAAPALAASDVPGERVGAASAGAALPAGDGAGLVSWPSGLTGTINLTMPLTTWLGLADGPGVIAGHGPADAWTCRQIAAALAAGQAGRYCVTVTTGVGQPLGHACTTIPPPRPSRPGTSMSGGGGSGTGPPGTGPPGDIAGWLAGLKIESLGGSPCDHRHETPGYRPGRRLEHLVKIRNPTCTAPGCRRPAIRSDLDHITPYDQGGRTCECNLHTPCRRHHRLKGTAGWHAEMTAPGTITWTLPHGRSYTTTPEPYPI